MCFLVFRIPGDGQSPQTVILDQIAMSVLALPVRREVQNDERERETYPAFTPEYF
jgi:hypothetical protein